MKQKSAPIVLLLALAFAFANTSMAQTATRNDVNPPVVAQTSQLSDVESTPTGSVNQKALARSLNRKANLFDDESSSTVNPEPAPQAPDPNDWQIRFAPYLWIAGITGRTGIGNAVVDVDSGITSDNVNLNFGFMGTFEAKKDRFIILTDLQYSNLGTERPNPGPLFSGATADFKTFILAPQVGYVLARNADKGHSLEVLGGVRIWNLKVDINLLPGILAARSASDSRSWVDAIGGLGGRFALSKAIFLLGKADVGGGGSKFTYQLFGGMGIKVHPKFAFVGGYRSLHVDYDKDNFLFDTTLSGPVLGAVWRIK